MYATYYKNNIYAALSVSRSVNIIKYTKSVSEILEEYFLQKISKNILISKPEKLRFLSVDLFLFLNKFITSDLLNQDLVTFNGGHFTFLTDGYLGKKLNSPLNYNKIYCTFKYKFIVCK